MQVGVQKKPLGFCVGNPPIAGEHYELALPSDHLSYTQIDCYLKCPENYRRTYVWGQRGGMNAAMYQGLLLTAVLEQVGLWALKGTTAKISNPKAALSLHKKYVKDGIPSQRGQTGKKGITKIEDVVSWLDTNPGTVVAQNEIFIQLFYRKELPTIAKAIVAVEDEFQMQLAGVNVLGYIDLTERHFVWDYKTSNSGGFFLKPDSSLQLKLGAHARQKEKAGYIVFDKGKKDVYAKRTSEPWDLRQVKEWLEFTVGSVAMAISAGIFPPCSPGENALCSQKWCPHWWDCAGKSPE